MPAQKYEITEEEAAALATCREIWDKGILKRYETLGFIKGTKKGKTMKVGLDILVDSLRKQMRDFDSVYNNWIAEDATAEELKQALADIRNLAGCCFLKILEDSKK